MTVITLALACVVVALLGLAAVSWFLGWGLGSALAASLREAGERTSEGALELWDWVRLGR
jgi:hypothetical protein